MAGEGVQICCAAARHADKRTCNVEMRSHRLAVFSARHARVRNDQGDVLLLAVPGCTFPAQAVCTGMLSMVGGQDDDRVVRHPEIFELVQNLKNVPIGILDAVQVIVVESLPPSIFVRDTPDEPRAGDRKLFVRRRASFPRDRLIPRLG